MNGVREMLPWSPGRLLYPCYTMHHAQANTFMFWTFSTGIAEMRPLTSDPILFASFSMHQTRLTKIPVIEAFLSGDQGRMSPALDTVLPLHIERARYLLQAFLPPLTGGRGSVSPAPGSWGPGRKTNFAEDARSGNLRMSLHSASNLPTAWATLSAADKRRSERSSVPCTLHMSS